MTKTGVMLGGCTASACFFLLGSVVGLGLATWTLKQELGERDDDYDDDDYFYYAGPYRLLSCLAASCYLLDVALDTTERRSKIVATCFGLGAALELLSTIIDSDWMMWIALHSYLASAGLILSKPPKGAIEGAGDVLFGIGCGFDVVLSYFYWDENFELFIAWGDVFSASLWFLNAAVVVVAVLPCEMSPFLDDEESIIDEESIDEHREELLMNVEPNRIDPS